MRKDEIPPRDMRQKILKEDKTEVLLYASSLLPIAELTAKRNL